MQDTGEDAFLKELMAEEVNVLCIPPLSCEGEPIVAEEPTTDIKQKRKPKSW